MAGQEKRPVAVTSNIAGDREVLADLLRAYGYVPTETGQGVPTAEAYWELEETALGPGGSSEGKTADFAGALPCLSIFWEAAQEAVEMRWQEPGSSGFWRQRQEVQPVEFKETAENRRRRLLRLCLHHLVAQLPGTRPSPWGILTGVRPVKVVQRFLDEGLRKEQIFRALTPGFWYFAGESETLYRIAVYQRPFLPELTENRKRISVYLGYPFCPKPLQLLFFSRLRSAKMAEAAAGMCGGDAPGDPGGGSQDKKTWAGHRDSVFWRRYAYRHGAGADGQPFGGLSVFL